MARADDIHLDITEFRLLREVFNAYAGLTFGPEARLVMERRLRDRVTALGLGSFSEYHQFLAYDHRGAAEIDEAIELVTINETYFMREAYQLRAFKDEVLPALRALAPARERLSVWSAGCSTGEEVYSIALLVRESGLFPERGVRVFGTDISRRVLARARRGVYGASSFRAMPTDLRRRYFLELADGAHVVDDLRSVCQFGQLNLLDTERSAIVGRVDVIFCRNVLIYFDEVARRRVIETFYDRLLPGGYLLLGHSESLLNVSTAFELVHLREDLVYRKPSTSIPRFSAEARASRAPARMGETPVLPAKEGDTPIPPATAPAKVADAPTPPARMGDAPMPPAQSRAATPPLGFQALREAPFGAIRPPRGGTR